MNITMYDCYLTQFRCMEKILEQKDSLLDEFVNYYLTVKPDRLYLVGSGTSHNACAASRAFMEEILGIEVIDMVPSHVSNIYGKNPMAIVVSQTGRSTNSAAAVERMRQNGCAVVTLTDPKDTAVGNTGNLAVSLEADREPIGQRTRGYTATVLTLYLMALESGLASGSLKRDAYGGHLNNLRWMVDNGPLYLDSCQQFYDKHLENLIKANNFIFVGKGTAGKTADEDALKVLETICYPSSGFEFEEFLHGPICSIRDNLALFLFLAEDEDRPRMLKLAEIASTVTPNCYVISHVEDLKDDNVLYLPSPDPVRLSPFTDILFGQLISAKMPEVLGRGRLPVVMEISIQMNTKFKVKN